MAMDTKNSYATKISYAKSVGARLPRPAKVVASSNASCAKSDEARPPLPGPRLSPVAKSVGSCDRKNKQVAPAAQVAKTAKDKQTEQAQAVVSAVSTARAIPLQPASAAAGAGGDSRQTCLDHKSQISVKTEETKWEGLPWSQDNQEWPAKLPRVYKQSEIPLAMQFYYRDVDGGNGYVDLRQIMSNSEDLARIDWEIKNMSLRPWKFTGFDDLERDVDELEFKVKSWILKRKGITKPQQLYSVRKDASMDPQTKQRINEWIEQWLTEQWLDKEKLHHDKDPKDTWRLQFKIKESGLCTLVDIITVQELAQRCAFRMESFSRRLLETLRLCGIRLADPEDSQDCVCEESLMPTAAEFMEFLHQRALTKGLYPKSEIEE